MGYVNTIGKYQLGRTIGEGTFAKVKLAANTENNQYVAIKIIDKHMVIENNLMHQVQREISTMKLLHHPNIARIHEVIGTKTKIYIVMEYVSGGVLSDKMSYVNRLSEIESRKHFQQLIDAVDYCHCRGVYHRDLKPQNLLLDSKGNLKVSDFGLSALRKPGYLLSTACGSPSYVAPELLTNKGYEGAAADVWSCGVLLFELLAGYLPFDDRNLMNLYRKENVTEKKIPHTPSFINAFQLIAMSHDLDLSGLFEEQDNEKQKTTLGSKHTINETIEKIEAAAKDVSLSVERMNKSKVKIHPNQKMTRCSRSCFNLSAEVIEVAPTHCVVEISKSVGELEPYTEFCKSLSSMLSEESGVPFETQSPKAGTDSSKSIQQSESIVQNDDKDPKDLRGYSSS
ncbi:CBL-interacting serine/threonine-protein kinase 21-like isoform X2 [Actinidia eriantha]|uniref:CBL-interacting serine/threonine-protein kinase 21-like isoform X2 n=1 Tax=Actinidia eriantha TaxID=165200 RepID=UPI002584207A|nr:CBL-interacting serine/threonine-protein kinase 21-like isoform X2 [Actinidia eriantha]